MVDPFPTDHNDAIQAFKRAFDEHFSRISAHGGRQAELPRVALRALTYRKRH